MVEQAFASRPVRYPPGKNPNSLANLKPYKPGENGHGRVYPLKERLRHALDHPLIEPPDTASAGDQIVYATLKGAIDLSPVAFRETWDRVEGKLLDQPPIAIDNRQVIIHVNSERTKELLGRIAERTEKPNASPTTD